MRTSTLYPRLPAILLLALFVCLGLAACASTYYSNVGKVAPEEYIIPAETGAGQQEWQTNDLKIVYTVKETGESFTVSGTVSLKGYIKRSFPMAERFRLYINYLDGNGKALVSEDVSPVIGFRRVIPETLKLRDVPPAPEKAVAFTFSYIGTFSGGSNADENSGDWEIYFNPFG